MFPWNDVLIYFYLKLDDSYPINIRNLQKHTILGMFASMLPIYYLLAKASFSHIRCWPESCKEKYLYCNLVLVLQSKDYS